MELIPDDLGASAAEFSRGDVTGAKAAELADVVGIEDDFEGVIGVADLDDFLIGRQLEVHAKEAEVGVPGTSRDFGAPGVDVESGLFTSGGFLLGRAGS